MASCLLFFAVFSLLAAAARSQSGDSKESSAEAVVVGSVVGGVCVLLFAGISAFYLYRRSGGVQSPHPRHSGSEEAVKITLTGVSSEPTDLHIVKAGNMEISIQVRRSATNNFSKHNIVGKGGFGTVCKGELHDGTKIAVKRIESGVMSDNGLDELHSEIADLTKVRHRHLVALLGYCLDGNEWLLVHEYMPQRTLSMFLFNWNEEGLSPLEWIKRLTIALDAARAVEYLHGLAQQSFVHGDLKPSNILLLGDDMRAKVADYELFRLGKASIATKPAGYLAPEYAASGRVSSKIDVFSFGVILMEMITGRKAMNESFPDEREHLVPWFRRMRISKDNFHKAIDPTLEINEVTLSNINTVSELAGLCTAREPHQRPDMGHVVNLLSSLVELWKPSEPAHPNDEMTLAQVHKKWQALEGISYRNTNTSIPSRSPGFAFSLTSMDGR